MKTVLLARDGKTAERVDDPGEAVRFAKPGPGGVLWLGAEGFLMPGQASVDRAAALINDAIDTNRLDAGTACMQSIADGLTKLSGDVVASMEASDAQLLADAEAEIEVDVEAVCGFTESHADEK